MCSGERVSIFRRESLHHGSMGKRGQRCNFCLARATVLYSRPKSTRMGVPSVGAPQREGSWAPSERGGRGVVRLWSVREHVTSVTSVRKSNAMEARKLRSSVVATPTGSGSRGGGLGPSAARAQARQARQGASAAQG